MKRTIVTLFAVFGLLLASCGSDGVGTDASGSVDADVEDADALASEPADDLFGGDDSDTDESDTDDSADAGESSDGDAMADDAGANDSDESADASEGDATGSQVLSQAMNATTSQSSGRFEGTIEVIGGPASEITVPVEIGLSGSFDAATQSSDMELDMSGMVDAIIASDPDMDADDPQAQMAVEMMSVMFGDPLQVRTIGDKSWVKWSLLAFLGVGDKWVETEPEQSTDMTSEFGFESTGPADLLESVDGSFTEPKVIGEETIRGITTTHHQAQMDLSTLTPEQREGLGETLADSPEGIFTFDAWIADDLVHRFEINATGLAQTADNDLASMRMIYDLFDHGLDPGITAPPASEVVTEAELGIDLDDVNSGG